MGLAGLAGLPGLSGIVPGVGAVVPPGPVAPEWFEVQITTTAPNQTYSWQLGGIGANAITQWGDGSSATHSGAGIFTKTYAEAGVYTLRLQASFSANGSFNMRPNTDRTRLSRLLSPVPNFSGLNSLSALVNGCTGITGTIPVDFLRYVVNVTNLANLANGCTGLSGNIPVDFLRYVVNVTNLQSLLGGCSGLTGETPTDLLRYTINATNLIGFITNCTRLRMRADIFGPDPNRFFNQSVNFSNSFRNVGTFAGTPQGTAPAVWNYNFGTGTPATAQTFTSSSNLTNWAQIPAAWGGPLV